MTPNLCLRRRHFLTLCLPPPPAGPEDLDVSLPWHLVLFCLVTGLLFAVDTGLYLSVKRELQRSLTSRRLGKVTWSKRP